VYPEGASSPGSRHEEEEVREWEVEVGCSELGVIVTAERHRQGFAFIQDRTACNSERN